MLILTNLNDIWLWAYLRCHYLLQVGQMDPQFTQFWLVIRFSRYLEKKFATHQHDIKINSCDIDLD